MKNEFKVIVKTELSETELNKKLNQIEGIGIYSIKEDKYNGWTNYETWLVKLWMDNDQGSYIMFNEWAKESEDIYTLSNQVKDFFEEENPMESAGVFTDLLNSALSEVNWDEIARALKEDNE